MTKQIKNPHDLNLPLFLCVIRVLEQEPTRIEMQEWCVLAEKLPDFIEANAGSSCISQASGVDSNAVATFREHFNAPPCNTVACVSGWSSILNRADVLRAAKRQGQLVPKNLHAILRKAAIKEARGGLAAATYGRVDERDINSALLELTSESDGRSALNLPYSFDVDTLFRVAHWPERKLRSEYAIATKKLDPQRRAKAVIKRIENVLVELGVNLQEFYAQKI